MRYPASLLTILFVTFASATEEAKSTLLPVIGVTEPGQQIDLAFSEAGVIRVVEVKEGDIVKSGALLAQLDCRVLETQHEIAKRRAESTAALESATATMEIKKERLAQLEKLAANARANADELARARGESSISQAEFQLAQEAKAENLLEAELIKAQIEQRTLRAPFDGVVASVLRDPGASVLPQDGTIISLVQLDQLDLVVHIDHQRLDGLVVGQEVKVDALDRPVTAMAKIAFISPVVDASSGTCRIRFVLPNGDRKHLSGVKYRIDLQGP